LTSIDRSKVHLINRLTFGPQPDSIDRYLKMEHKTLIQCLFDESKSVEPLKAIRRGIPYEDFAGARGRTKRIQRKRKMKSQKQLVNKIWIEQMTSGSCQLRDKMAFFWHDHFATNIPNPVKTYDQIKMLRKFALGSFKKMLIAISKGPAMIDFLNSKENVKGQPNENFAREILELFTLGVGNYTEKDIQEAARAFTGWQYDEDGKFFVDKSKHDNDLKEFLGQKGRWTGDDIIRIILEQDQTARYIVSKIYYFLTGTLIKAQRLEELAINFKPKYNIGKLIYEIVSHEDFYRQEIIGTRVKSPIELLVGIMRLIEIQFTGTNLLSKIQFKLDQILLAPPNVSGWRSGKEWINMGTLVDRLSLAEKLYKGDLSDYLYAPQITQEGDEVINYNKRIIKGMKRRSIAKLNNWVTKQCNGDILICAEMMYSCDHKHVNAVFERMYAAINKGKLDQEAAILMLFSFPEYQLN